MDDDQIKSLLKQDRKIKAIYLTMKQNGWELKKSKDYVESLQRELFPRYAGVSDIPGEPDKFMIDKARQFIAQGRKVEAIQFLHHATGMTLKESKDYVDKLALKRS